MKAILYFICAYILGTIIVQFAINTVLEEAYNNAIIDLDNTATLLLKAGIFVIFPTLIGGAVEASIFKFLISIFK